MTLQIDDEKEERELREVRSSEEEDLIKLLAEKHSLPYIDLIPLPVETGALRVISEQEARAAKVAPFSLNGKKVAVALFSPDAEATKNAVASIQKAGFSPTLYMAGTRSLEKVWKHYQELSRASETRAGEVELGSGAIAEIAASVKTLEAARPRITEVLNGKAQNRISHFVEILLGTAIAIDASDIHIEPEEKNVRIRFRLDGILQEALSFDFDTYRLLNSRIKLLAGLKLNVRAEAQDGRFSVNLKDTAIEVRTSTLPGAHGESIVMRLLNPKSISVPLENLGMHPFLLAIVNAEITKPNGMLLTTGPTGSGKTTTLYAVLRKIHTPGVKTITIEDPIEYHLAGIVQTQVEKEKHYTFASGLRAALRQDPDVIMVGEIRDEETAEIAINASLTGHLVFSTLHTNNAAGTFPRLIDLGVNPKVITSAITLAMAQRLVRKLCPECKKKTALSEKDRAHVEAILQTLPASLQPKEKETYMAVGCEKCNKTGYKGRIGVYEAIRTDGAIEKIVRENPSEREIEAVAKPQGIPTMMQDGILKVLAGITSFEELGRVVDLNTGQ